MMRNELKGLGKDVKQHALWAESRGWRVERTRKGHIAFKRSGAPTVFFSGTPGDYRALRNSRRELIRVEEQTNERVFC